MQREEEDRLPYEQALRAIGRHLDAEPAYNFNVREGADGFTVRYSGSMQPSEQRIAEFTWDRLGDLHILQVAGRGGTRRHGRYNGIWAENIQGHQDFFRALGHVLDQDQARDVVVEERDEGILVSYIRPDPEHPGSRETFTRMLTADGVKQLVDDARKRRGQSPSRSA